mmetsp:Transcript_7896/g.28005  ORF Transcript_7896/g.28005 Transcript_7896/m.28005 type:complete len:567 (-) Transcript_7896:104-1804(-)
MAASAVDKPTRGPRFTSARTVVLSELDDAAKERFMSFLVESNVQFFKDSDGSYCANVRMVEPGEGDAYTTAESPTSRASGSARKASRSGARARATSSGGQRYDFSMYPKFCSLITLREELQPKKRPLTWLMRLLEEIYDSRYARDMADIKDEDPEETERLAASFPVFVIDFFSKRYGLRQLVEQTCWDLLYNVHLLRKEELEVEMFARFLEEYYDADDLLFFLYVRSVTQKEVGVSFKQMWTEAGRGRDRTPSTVTLNFRECQVISRVVFGSDADPMYRTFMTSIEGHLVGSRRGKTDTRRIEVMEFLQLALVEYHEMAPDGGGSGGAGGGGGAGGPVPGEAAAAAGAGDGVLGSREEQERLFREAEAQYEDRMRSSAAAPAPTSAAAPPPPASASRGAAGGTPAAAGGSPAGGAPPRSAWLDSATPAAPASPAGGPDESLLQTLDTLMQRSTDEYLTTLMTAGHDLPREVRTQISNEVRTQLEAKVDDVLGGVIERSRGAPTADDELATQFRRLQTGGGNAGEVKAFCSAVLKTSDVRQEIEPLVALLVTYASARLREEGGAPSS